MDTIIYLIFATSEEQPWNRSPLDTAGEIGTSTTRLTPPSELENSSSSNNSDQMGNPMDMKA